MGPENDIEALPEEEISVDALRAAIEAKDVKKAAAIAEAMLTKVPDAFAELLITEQLPVAEIAVQTIVETVENDMEKTKLLLMAMHNKDKEVALVAAGALKQAGLHIGLLKKFQQEANEMEKQILARAIALTHPIIPREVVEFLEAHPDVVAANAAAERIGVRLSRRKITAEERQALFEALDRNDTVRVEDIHRESIERQRDVMLRRAMIATGYCKANDPDIVEKQDRIAAMLREAGVQPEQFYRRSDVAFQEVERLQRNGGARAIPLEELEKIRAVTRSIARDDESYYHIANDEIMLKLAQFQDKSYYRAYVDVLASDLGENEKTKEQLRILFTAALQEPLSYGKLDLAKHLLSETSVAAEHAVFNIAEVASSGTGISKIAEAVTAVAAVSAIVRPSADESPVTRKMHSQMSPDMQVAIRNADRVTERRDGSVEVEIEGQSVIFEANGETLSAHVEARDGTKFRLPKLSIPDLEQAMLFGVTQHDLHRSIWQGKYTDREILKYAFRLDVTDDTIGGVRDQRLFTQNLAAMPNFRTSMITMHRDLGVLDDRMNVNRVRAIRVYSLLRYLDANLGLKFVKSDDIHAIAEVWKKADERGERLALMTPDQARSQLETVA